VKLCINADDYLSHEQVDAGIRDAIDAGAVTSVSVMGDAEYGPSQDLLLKSRVSFGLHLSLTSGGNRCLRQFSGPFSIAKAGLLGRLPIGLVEKEVAGQYSRFVAAVGKAPSHLDCHQHIHAWPALRRVVLDLAARNSIPYVRIPRDCSPDFALKKLLLRTAFAGKEERLAFFGVNLMGKAFTWINVQRQFEYLARKGVRRALWMVHVGYRNPRKLNGRNDYGYRDVELDVLLRNIARIREYADLVSMENLLN